MARSTANRANALLGGRGRAFWQRKYFDRWIRSDEQLESVISYAEDDPVQKGLSRRGGVALVQCLQSPAALPGGDQRRYNRW